MECAMFMLYASMAWNCVFRLSGIPVPLCRSNVDSTLSFLFFAAGVRAADKSTAFMEKKEGSYPYDRGGQTVIVNQSEEKRSNGLGTAGFVLALLGLIFSWMPGLGWVLWLLGLIFSFVGIFRVPRGLAIAGLVMSCIALIILIVVAGAIGTLIAAM